MSDWTRRQPSAKVLWKERERKKKGETNVLTDRQRLDGEDDDKILSIYN